MSPLVLRALFGVCIVIAAGFGCGAWIIKKLPVGFNRAERSGIALLGGMGLLSVVLFLIGQASFRRTTIWAALCAAVLLAIRQSGLLLRDSIALRRATSKGAQLPGLVVLLILVITAIAGTVEITGDWNNDAVAYHLLGPRVWLREGVIRPVPDNSLTAFPQIPETLFATLIAAGGNRAPDFSSWLTLGLFLLVSAGLGLRLGLSGPQAWWVAAIVATMPAVYAGSHGCFVDALYAAFVLAATRIAFDAQKLQEWAVFGIFCGLAMGTKYTGLLAAIALTICCVLLLLARNQLFHAVSVRHLAVAFAAACVVASPFYIRNWILLGCPIYPPAPGYAAFCSPKYLSRDAIEQLHDYISRRGAGLGRGWIGFLKLPFNLTYHTSNFHGAGGLGLCPLGLAPFGIVALWKNTFARLLGLLGFVLMLFWFVTQQESRFLIHVYAIGAIFSVAGWNYVAINCGRLQRFTAACLVGTSILYGLLMITRSQSDELRAAASPRYAKIRRERDIPYLASFEYLNGHQSVKNVLILDPSVPPYYCDKPYIKIAGQWGEQPLSGLTSAVDSLQHIHELHITHILDVVSPVSGFQIKSLGPGLTMAFESTNERIYQVD